MNSRIAKLKGNIYKLLSRPEDIDGFLCSDRLHLLLSGNRESCLSEQMNFGPPWCGHKPELLHGTGLRSIDQLIGEAEMAKPIESILTNPALELTPTDRLVVLQLAQSPSGLRIDDIAKSTGSKYRWIENEVLRLTRIGVLLRVAPNTYAINTAFGVAP